MPSNPKKPLGPFSDRAHDILDEWLVTHQFALKNPKIYYTREEFLSLIDFWIERRSDITDREILQALNRDCVRPSYFH